MQTLSAPPGSRDRRSSGLRLGDRYGLTATAAVLLTLTGALLGATFDLLTGEGLRLVFGVSFVLACALAAVLVHREDLFTVVVLPPLVFLAPVLLAGLTERPGGTDLGKGLVVELLSLLVLQAPTMLLATLAAAVVSLARRRRGRR